MTRKDYVLIAETLLAERMRVIDSREYDDGEREDYETQCERDARALADALANDNPRFDRERFLKACGVQS